MTMPPENGSHKPELSVSLKEHFDHQVSILSRQIDDICDDIRSLRESRAEAIGKASQANYVAWIGVAMALISLVLRLAGK